MSDHLSRRHVPRLVQSHHVLDQLHGSHAAGRFNAWLAVKVTRIVATMWCAYLFAAFALLALPSAIAAGSLLPLVNWASSNFAQLVLLPLIMVGQAQLQAASDARAEADHKTLTALHAMNVQQLDILEGQNRILGLLERLVPEPPVTTTSSDV